MIIVIIIIINNNNIIDSAKHPALLILSGIIAPWKFHS